MQMPEGSNQRWPLWAKGTELLRRASLATPLLVVLVAAAMFYPQLGASGLWDEDEPRNAAASADMLARGDWVVPYFNGQLRTQKPVLLYWLQICSYKIFGVNEFAARFPSATLSIGTAALVWWLGRLLFSNAVGLLAGIMFATSLMLTVAARASTPDGGLIFSVVLTMAFYVRGCSTREPGSFGQSGWIPPNAWRMALVYAGMGLGMLAKGPVGVLLPTAIIGLFILIVSTAPAAKTILSLSRYERWSQRLTRMAGLFPIATWRLRPLLGAIVILAIAGPWYYRVHVETNGEWTRTFLGFENLTRFREAQEGHRGPIVYYVAAMMIGFFPWSSFLPFTIWRAAKMLWTGHTAEMALPEQRAAGDSLPERDITPAIRFLFCWLAIWVGIFSFAATKLPSYVLPAYAVLALLTAQMLIAWVAQPAILPRVLTIAAWSSYLVVGIGMMIGLAVAAKLLFPAELWLGAIGVIPLAGGSAAWYAARQGEQRWALAALGIMACCLSPAMFAWGAPRVAAHQNSPRVLARVHELVSEYVQAVPKIATYHHPESSVIYYAQQPVRVCKEPAEIVQLFADAEQAFVITSRAHYDRELRSRLPRDVEVLLQEPRFLKKDEVVLLGRQPQIMAKFPTLTR
jgi:4-amino-4-deoxy-L-arabinose transferase-like glycosyltransferase